MFGLPKFGDGIALSRIERFYRAHNIDTARLAKRSIVVTGSNGKGSTARFITDALQARGLHAGCFTSPHLFHVRERFVIGNVAIEEPVFEAHAATVLKFNESLPEGDRIGAFEFLFLVAILWFEEKRPDAIIWEAGIGGRYDPVRTVRARVSCLTSIELEHTALLGATEELIAFDKIDALAPGGKLVVSPCVPAGLRERIESYCALTDRKPVFAGDNFSVSQVVNQQAGTSFFLSSPDVKVIREVNIKLIGRHQVDNAITAWRAACEWLGVKADLNRTRDLLEELSSTTWSGRLEKASEDPDLWVDVGHTPGALDCVTKAFTDLAPRDSTLAVFGVSASKEVTAIAEIVADRFDHFILTKANKAGADIGSFAPVFAGRDVTIEPDISNAARTARERAMRKGMTVIALGGLFVAAEFEHAWRGGNPAELDFF